MSIENSLKFLWECATTLKPTTHTHKLIKSYYINVCRRMLTVTRNLPLPQVLSSLSQMCPKCGCLWQESDFKLKLRPQQIAHKAKTDKLLRKFEQNQKCPSEQNALTKKQKRRAKWLKKRLRNYLEVNCQQCHNKTQIPMQKPLKSQTTLKMAKKSFVNQRKEKTKNVNQNAATNLNIVKKDPLQKQQHQVIMKNLITNNNKSTKHQKQQQHRQQQRQQNKHPKQQSKKQLIITKTKAPSNTKSSKKSSLVQLAALLKQKSTVGKNETVTKHLQALLK